MITLFESYMMCVETRTPDSSETETHGSKAKAPPGTIHKIKGFGSYYS
jgi:hypothetical protein